MNKVQPKFKVISSFSSNVFLCSKGYIRYTKSRTEADVSWWIGLKGLYEESSMSKPFVSFPSSPSFLFSLLFPEPTLLFALDWCSLSSLTFIVKFKKYSNLIFHFEMRKAVVQSTTHLIFLLISTLFFLSIFSLSSSSNIFTTSWVTLVCRGFHWCRITSNSQSMALLMLLSTRPSFRLCAEQLSCVVKDVDMNGWRAGCMHA